jgi:adhesin/invasin
MKRNIKVFTLFIIAVLLMSAGFSSSCGSVKQELIGAAESFNIMVTPGMVNYTVGQQLTLTATVTDETGRPVKGVSIMWGNQDGPGSIMSVEGDTDGNGQAQAVVSSDTDGKAIIIASLANDFTVNDTATINWTWSQMTAPVVLDFNITINPSMVNYTVGKPLTLTATVTDQNNKPVKGVSLMWGNQDGPGSIVSVEGDTNDNGQAKAMVSSDTDGKTLIVVSLADDFYINDTATINWTFAQMTAPVMVAVNISITPATGENSTGGQVTLTATVTDQNNKPLTGVSLMWGIQDGPGSILSVEGDTDDNGQAQAVVSSDDDGQTIIVASLADDITNNNTASIYWVDS